LRRAGIDHPIPEQVVFSNAQRPSAGGASSTEESHLKLLAQVDLFSGLAKETLSRLYKASHQQLYAREQSIVRAGEEGTSLFVILKGSVVVSTPAGAELAALQEADYFGEMSFLTGAVRTATVVARSQCTVLEIPSDAFRGQIRRHPQLLEVVSAVVERRAQELSLKAAQTSPLGNPVEPTSLIGKIRDFLLSPLGSN
jgi:CRP-like cAMP-binding protein